MTSHLLTIARLELLSAARLWWIRLLAAAFALIAMAAAYAAGAATELSGPDGFARTTMALVPIVLVLIPLAALVLGVSGQSAEAGGDAFLFAQPVERAAVVLGRWLGQSVALGGAILLGFGAGAVLITLNAGPDDLPRFLFFVLASVLLGVMFLSVAALVAATAETRAAALGIGTFVWFFFVLLYDGVALSVAGWITGSAGGRLLFASVFGNPTDLVRVLVLSISGTPSVLGAAGEAWMRFLGGPASAIAVAVMAVSAWIIVPLGVAVRQLGARDL